MAVTAPGAPCVEARGLRRIYETPSGPVAALDGVDFSANAGEIVGVIGRSGSGKTTLLTLIGLLDQPSSGTLSVCGFDVAGARPRNLARVRRGRIGFLFQDAGLIERMKVLEAVMLPLRYAGVTAAAARSRAVEALASVQLDDKGARRVSALSGGERQRVGLARALAQHAELVICDEPTAALDKITARVVAARLRAEADRGACVIAATHDPLLMDAVDRVVAFDAGRTTDPAGLR
ncbi:MAG: ATP-binding cassette domain-containing protein [Oceanicaulis sp.]